MISLLLLAHCAYTVLTKKVNVPQHKKGMGDPKNWSDSHTVETGERSMDVQQGAERRSQVSPDVIARARHDRAAFGEIYDHNLPRVYAFCRLHSASREEAQDLTAHSFERALDAIHGGLEGGSPRHATARGGGHLTTYTGGRRWHPSPDTGRIHSLLSRRWCPVSHSDLWVHG